MKDWIRLLLEDAALIISGHKLARPDLHAVTTSLDLPKDVRYKSLARIPSEVAGGVPFFSFIQECLRSSVVTRIVGQVNSAANFVLLSIAKGETFDHAIEEAGKLGILEANYHFDTLGNDSAWKTVITANSIFGSALKPHNIRFEGVEGLDPSVTRGRGAHYLRPEISKAGFACGHHIP